MAQLSTEFSTIPKTGGFLKTRRPAGYYAQVLAKTDNSTSTKTRNQLDPVVSSSEFAPAFWEANHKPPTQARCTRQYFVGQTSNAQYFKAIQCGKDWCSDCGQILSTTHKRRINPIFPRLRTTLQAGFSIGYLVITIPKELRKAFLSKEALKDFRDYWRRKLKREGYEYGVIRYHWAGEDGYQWHPHLNILFPAGFIPRETLSIWRDELSKWFAEYLDLKLQKRYNPETRQMEKIFPASNLYFHYLKPKDENAESKLWHWVKYVTRATQTQPNKVSIKVISGFRNTSIFGGKNWIPTLYKPEEIEAAARKGFEFDPETGEIEKIVWISNTNENTGKKEI
jgi:hypothetical protein